MRKLFLSFWLILAAGLTTTVFTSCEKDDDKKFEPTLTADQGVVINGVKWATRNIDEPGKFAPTPESAGKFYQWNRKVAWSTTEPGLDVPIPDWDDTFSRDATEWARANDPSPTGWRVPTFEEVEKLLDTNKVSSEWTIQNGINGRKFTDKTTRNTLFLPAVGARLGDGRLISVGTHGGYQLCASKTESVSICTYLEFSSTEAKWNDVKHYGVHTYGLSVRSVAE